MKKIISILAVLLMSAVGVSARASGTCSQDLREIRHQIKLYNSISWGPFSNVRRVKAVQSTENGRCLAQCEDYYRYWGRCSWVAGEWGNTIQWGE